VASIPSQALNRDAAPSEGRIAALPFLAVLAQLGLLMLVLRQFQIESGAFLRLATLAFGGFVVHALLPLRYRLHFFLFLSLAGIVLVLGFGNGAWLVALGLVLIGICHLPIAFSLRVAILLTVVAIFALQRADWLPAPWSSAIWPILGSMFMFRLIVYLYDLRFEKAPPSFVRTLTYFFMLPNACFPLFPVIDYKSFRRNYFDADAFRIYQTGIDWILRGIIHLLLYRFVYYYLTLAPAEVLGPWDLGQYLISNFLLYLRVSGLFHLVVGMLYLFGFRLPETHHEYLLASSFTDFWRRINVYWKDFMMKVFYYPAYFRLRKLGAVKALVISTVFVLVMTWFLHLYQWFWLRGSALLVWQDMLFWAFFGGLVVANAIHEERSGRQVGYGLRTRTRGMLFRLTLQTLATFCAICALWSFWTSDSFAEWLSLWSAIGGKMTFHAGHLVIPVVALIIVGGVLRANLGGGSTSASRPAAASKTPSLRIATAATVGLLVLLPLGVESFYARLGTEVASTVQALRSGRLSRLDNAKLERGYYENLLQVDRFNSPLWEVYMKKPANWLDIESGALKQFTNDFAQAELKPSFAFSTNYGMLSVNRWGMRDRDYERKPAPDTFRMALLGSSSVMGWGVGDGETFESLVEKQLNEEKVGAYKDYEILNFAVAGYQPPQQLVALDKAFAFEPRAVLYVATGREISRSNYYLIEAVRKGLPIPYAPLRELMARAGVTSTTDETTALKQLEPYRTEILTFVYRRIADESRMRGIVPLWIFLPQLQQGPWQEETPETFRLAEAAGFVILDLSDVFKGNDLASLRLAEWDDHPSVFGHKLIAARLSAALRGRQNAIFGDAKR
jgi:alginate O-acetyltransferase complex protein AlgI